MLYYTFFIAWNDIDSFISLSYIQTGSSSVELEDGELEEEDEAEKEENLQEKVTAAPSHQLEDVRWKEDRINSNGLKILWLDTKMQAENFNALKPSPGYTWAGVYGQYVLSHIRIY